MIDKERRKHIHTSQLPPRVEVPVSSPSSSQSIPQTAKTSCDSTRSQTTLKFRLLGNTSKTLVKVFPVEASLSEVAEAVLQEMDVAVASFIRAGVPQKAFAEADFNLSLKGAGLVSNTVLIVKQKESAEMISTAN